MHASAWEECYILQKDNIEYIIFFFLYIFYTLVYIKIKQLWTRFFTKEMSTKLQVHVKF